MAGVGTLMQITPVDSENNLFRVENVVSAELSQQVQATDWTILPWTRQPGQEQWARRCIVDSAISWMSQWHEEMNSLWPSISDALGIAIAPYCGTAFWLDEQGFTCGMHTDGELPGSLHMTWIGSGTTFYWHNNPNTVRYQIPSQPNAGYIMTNVPDNNSYRKLQWHAMLNPVPKNTFRLTSYTWIIPQ
jgi:hypothetical protein